MKHLLNTLRLLGAALAVGVLAQLGAICTVEVVKVVAPDVQVVSLVAPAAHAGAITDGAENKLIDALLRAQSLGAPATGYWALGTNACSDAGSPTEPSGNGYARVAVTASLTNWSGTLNSSQTVASTGTGGTSYNLNAITLPTSTGAWASSANLVSVWMMDAATAGSPWLCITLTAPVAVTGSGFTLSFPAGSLSFQADN